MEVCVMLITETVPVAWTKHWRKRYEDMGYTFTKWGDSFDLSVTDLTNSSERRVEVKCDYCGLIMSKPWHKYLSQHDEKYGDCCKACRKYKTKNTVLDKYGVDNVFQSEDIKNKIKDTMVERYGETNPMNVESFKQKQQDSVLEKYGVDNPSKSDIIKDKKKNTCLENYGVDNPMKCSDICIDVINKQRNFYESIGSTPSSKLEIAMCDVVKSIYGEMATPSRAIGYYTLDCELIIGNAIIDIEYDGLYWHSSEQAIKRDRRRDAYMKHNGYKVLRFKSDRNVPTKEQIIEAVDYLVKGNHDYLEINLDI